jgi:hypothetical protein
MTQILAKSFPHIDDMLWLIRVSAPFPVPAPSVLDRAKLWGFSKRTQDFLRLFPEDEVFQNRADFMDRCEELELLLYGMRSLAEPSRVLQS